MKLKQLDPRHERFCQEYVIDLNGKEAAIRAGYSPKTAAQQASRFLAQDLIKTRIAELQTKVAEKLEISQERILAELARIGFANINDYLAFNQGGVILKDSETLTREQLSVISEVSEGKEGIKLKMHSKLDAIEKMGKHLGMWKEKVEVTGTDGGPIETKDVSDPKAVARAIAFALAAGKAAQQKKTD